jgi:ribA/ribD-fused uncharacterized protein
MRTIPFTKVAAPYGWLGNMSPHPIQYAGKAWRTAEALFQALRFSDQDVIAEIRAASSPMTAKMIAKRERHNMIIQPTSQQDLDNMRMVLRLKIEQHPDLRQALLDTKDAEIIEDCSRRRASPWGAQFIAGQWVGDNLLGKLWMELRDQLY